MLTVYRVRAATERYQLFETDSISLFQTCMKIHGEEIRTVWQEPPLFLGNPKKKEADFFGFLAGRVFAVAEELILSHPELQTFFYESGEMLPFTHKGRKFCVFNCTKCISALDEGKTVFPQAGTWIKKYEFIPTRFHYSLFCIPQNNELLTVEGLCLPEDEFKGYVEEKKLTGLIFEKLWTGNDQESR